jgi:hypothetical protein
MIGGRIIELHIELGVQCFLHCALFFTSHFGAQA